MDFLIDWHENCNLLIEPYVNYAQTYEELEKKILENLNINLVDYTYELVERKTEKGFNMKFHRDNYMLRKYEDGFKFLLFDNCDAPIYSLIWYKNEEFKGGSLQFINNIIIKPKKFLFVFFDSNHLHKVNEQLSGTRIVDIYKFYDKKNIN